MHTEQKREKKPYCQRSEKLIPIRLNFASDRKKIPSSAAT